MLELLLTRCKRGMSSLQCISSLYFRFS